jgi:hypothetical protein
MFLLHHYHGNLINIFMVSNDMFSNYFLKRPGNREKTLTLSNPSPIYPILFPNPTYPSSTLGSDNFSIGFNQVYSIILYCIVFTVEYIYDMFIVNDVFDEEDKDPNFDEEFNEHFEGKL